MDPVVHLKVEITKPEAQVLEGRARDANLPLSSYTQRLLQHAANAQMQMPNTLARQLARLAAATMGAAKEVNEARRAYSACDGNEPKMVDSLNLALSKVSTTLDKIADTQRQIV